MCVVSQGKVDGYVKVGPKKLFINHENRMCEIEPLCVLDIYVHHTRQRSGVGYKLFCSMLRVCRAPRSRIRCEPCGVQTRRRVKM